MDVMDLYEYGKQFRTDPLFRRSFPETLARGAGMGTCGQIARDVIRKQISELESLHARIGPDFESVASSILKARRR